MSATTTTIPPLVDGERLTADEFHRRYQAMPHVKRAELIQGVVSMPSPVSASSHGTPHARLVWWLVSYEVFTPGVQCVDNGTVRLDDENEPQPDALLFVAVPGRGQARLSGAGYVEGAPEFVAEVSATTARIDLNAKFHAYQRNGVREYLVWRSDLGTFEWHVLREAAYERLTPGDGILRSEAFPGLWLDPAALIRGDLTAVLATLQRGVTTPEHADFIARLARR